MVLFHRLGGVDAALNVRGNAGIAYAPHLSMSFARMQECYVTGWIRTFMEMVLELEPGHTDATAEQFDNACRALGRLCGYQIHLYADTFKWRCGPCEQKPPAGGLPESDVTTIRRAALLKEIGRTGITSSIWEKAGSLTEREWERVVAYTYYAERILSHMHGACPAGSVGFAAS